MKITNIEVFLLRGALENLSGHPAASYVTDGSIYVKISTDVGIVGLGEPSAYGGSLLDTKRIIEKKITPRLIGMNPFDVDILTTQNGFPGGFGYGNVPYNCAIAGISQGLWDIIGKALDIPVYKLLNKKGDYKKKVRAYASGGMFYEWEDSMQFVEEALKCKEEGYTAWKLRPPTPRIASHLERNKTPPPVDLSTFTTLLEKIRLAVGDEMELMVDMGCRLETLKDAVYFCNAAEELDLAFVEEPLPRIIDEYVNLSAETNVPIAGGECMVNRHQFHKWFTKRALDILQPDGNLAGITEVMHIASIAEEKNANCIIHNWANDISIATNVHLAAAIPNCPVVEYNITYNPLRASLVKDPLVPVDGFFEISDRPGLGVELDDDALLHFSLT